MKHGLWGLMLITLSAQAFDFGPVTVSSHIDQPFKASIPVQLANNETMNAQLMLSAILSYNDQPIPLKVVYDPRTQDLKLSSPLPITQDEIFLSVSAADLTHQVLAQEYTIRLDKTEKPYVYGPVGAGDTLWKVATKFADHYHMTPEEAASALYQNNQRAFVNGDMNQLMAGSFLKITSQGQPKVFAPMHTREAEAAPTVPAATQSSPLASVVNGLVQQALPNQASLESGTQVAMNLSLPGPSLQLLLPKDGISQAVASTVDHLMKGDQTGMLTLLDGMYKDLSMAKEGIDTERRAKEALQNQLNDLEMQLRALTELVSMKDQEIETLLGSYQLQKRADDGIFSWSAIPSDFSSMIAVASHNQIILILLAIVIASMVIYVWDHFKLGAPVTAGPTAMRSAPLAEAVTQVKAQPLQPPVPPSLKEVDLYIAYGRYAQAQDILEDMLLQHPNDFDILLKLMQVYIKSDDRLAYERKISKISDRWKEKYPNRWERIHDMYMRAWPMDYDMQDVPTYEGDPPSDPVQTKLDLARAYIDIGDHESAEAILREVVKEGNTSQAQSANLLLSNL